MSHAVQRLAAGLVAGFVIMCGGWDPAAGTTMIQFSTEQLTVEAEFVVEGVVTNVESRYHEEHQTVYTYATVQVDQQYKGRVTDSIELVVLGGTVGDLRVFVHSTPAFEVSERVVIFLETREDGLLRCFAMAQGKFSVRVDEATGERIAVRPDEIELVYGRNARGELDSTIDPLTMTRRYSRLVEIVEAWADRLVAPGGE